MIPRTSVSNPLFIDSVRPGDSTGLIGMTLCPGKTDPHGMTGPWERDLNHDLEAVVHWGAKAVVSLITDGEIQDLKVQGLEEQIESRGLKWFHLPVADSHAPDGEFRSNWVHTGPELHAILDQGNNIMIHCRGGLGRAGTLTAQLLFEYGSTAEDAILRVRESRNGAIETKSQVDYIRGLGFSCS